MAKFYTFTEWLQAHPEITKIADCELCINGFVECPNCRGEKIKGHPCDDCRETGEVDCTCMKELKQQYEDQLSVDKQRLQDLMKAVR